MFVEIVAGYLVLRYAIHWLAGAALGVIFVIAAAYAGIWWPLAFLIVGIAIVVWIIRRVAREDAPARQVGDLATGYSFDSRDSNSLRADFGARLERTRRWSQK
jgi:hypothetical protein